MSCQSPSLLRDRLRAATAPLHADLDRALEARGDFRSLAGYRRYLAAMYRFRAPIEVRVARTPWPVSFGAWRPVAIAGALASDLADLQVTGAVIEQPAGDAPRLGALLGILYVLEGSALGARFLLGDALVLGLTPTHGARHLALQAGGVQNWHGFLRLLASAALDDAEADACVAAACATFAAAASAFAVADPASAAAAFSVAAAGAAEPAR